MINLNEHDYIQSYAVSVDALSQSPDNKELQHQAVLSLARAGSLDFAVSEYMRYELDQVRHNEDIMALGGRLSKDLYLRALRHADNAEIKKYAQCAARQYEAAFEETKGYYSGINAASMALIAGMPQKTVAKKAQAILANLPRIDILTPKDHYFIEATRAECFLLCDDIVQATESLKAAIMFDPLNYTAHATTIKQFRMILQKKDIADDWLSPFSPPRPIHYAGHLNFDLSKKELESLSISVSDQLQQYDIGFGYGALAAGSDIIIAEALLQEGAELHVLLPCEIDLFIEHSVKPFGGDWVLRFKACLEKAASLKILTRSVEWPSLLLNQICGKTAMGQSVLRSQQLAVQPAQLLIWNGQKEASYTAFHAKDWEQTGQTQIILPVKQHKSSVKGAELSVQDVDVLLQRSDEDSVVTYSSVLEAAQSAIDIRAENEGVQIGLHVNLLDLNSKSDLLSMTKQAIPNGILLSEVVACLLSYLGPKNLDINFAGLVKDTNGKAMRSYSLS